jgi:hypothetical protein
MKTGRTLQEMAAELDRQSKAKRDFVVSAGAMRMENGAEIFSLARSLDGGTREAEPFGMSDLFHRQMGASLGIPAKYYDKMRAEYPDLLVQNVNGWFERAPSRHTIRTLDGTARAFLSDRYRRIDNYDIAKAALPVIGEMQDARVESCEVTDNRMYVKVVNPRLEAEVSKGDIVQAGIMISNSEVGLGSVTVMPLVYRLVCLNGMIVNDCGQRKYHIGREVEESWELFSDAALEAEDNAFMLKLADIVRTAVDEAKFGMVVDKLRQAAQIRITGHVPEVVELTARQYGFTKTEETDILQHLISGGDLSLYGLSGAVTRASQDAADYDRATALESVGWQIATMPADTWRAVNGGVTA